MIPVQPGETVMVCGAARRAVQALVVDALFDRAELLGVEDVGQWAVGIEARLTFRAYIPAADPAGLTFHCDLDGEPLVSARARDLVDDGTPIDAAALAAELAWQTGATIPDDLSGLI